jgi:3-methylcrotonyl-CoA carboxylase alpha subunit
MEAMKMEHILRAPKDGVIATVNYKTGDFVDGGQVVVQLK